MISHRRKCIELTARFKKLSVNIVPQISQLEYLGGCETCQILHQRVHSGSYLIQLSQALLHTSVCGTYLKYF